MLQGDRAWSGLQKHIFPRWAWAYVNLLGSPAFQFGVVCSSFAEQLCIVSYVRASEGIYASQPQFLCITHELAAADTECSHIADLLSPFTAYWIFGRSAKAAPVCLPAHCLWYTWKAYCKVHTV